MRICRIKTIHISVISQPCVDAEREKEWRAKERKRQMFVEGRKQKATEPLRDFRSLQILLLLLTFQSGHESRLISCHFSLTLLSPLGTEPWQLWHSHSPSLLYCPWCYNSFLQGFGLPVKNRVIFKSHIIFFVMPFVQVLLWSSDRSACGLAPGHLIQSEW